jgi:Flp pilus assembly protein TadG
MKKLIESGQKIKNSGRNFAKHLRRDEKGGTILVFVVLAVMLIGLTIGIVKYFGGKAQEKAEEAGGLMDKAAETAEESSNFDYSGGGSSGSGVGDVGN